MAGVGPLTSTIGLLREDPATAAEFMAWDVKVNAIAGTEQGCVESTADLQIDIAGTNVNVISANPLALAPGGVGALVCRDYPTFQGPPLFTNFGI